MNIVAVFLGTILLWTVLTSKYLAELTDKVQFDIAWLGPLADSQDGHLLSGEIITLKTEDHEEYKCILPSVKQLEEESTDSSAGSPAEILLQDLLSGNAKCSYRLEPYWTYEVCHGSHVRQYHEEKDSEGATKLQQFWLGQMNKKDESVMKANEKLPKMSGISKKVYKMNIDGRNTPYFSQLIGNGTPCDLNAGKPRQVNVVYICHPSSNNEVMSVKETTTCEYEVIILNPSLCENPAYLVKGDPVHQIKCHSLNGAPSRPSLILDHEAEKELDQSTYPKKVNLVEKTAHPELPQEEVRPEQEVEPKPPVEPLPDSHRDVVARADDQLTREFLEGTYCLQGGTGWWKYEFCYGKYVSQYHEEPDGSLTIVYLGFWEEQDHLEWIKTRKKTKSVKYLIHYYNNGDMCDLTGKPRTAQVKLKCKKNVQGQEMSIYLLEPSPCDYVVGVESPVLCPLIEKADENGLIQL